VLPLDPWRPQPPRAPGAVRGAVGQTLLWVGKRRLKRRLEGKLAWAPRVCSEACRHVAEREFSVAKGGENTILGLHCTVFFGFLILGLVAKTYIWERQELWGFICARLLEYLAYQVRNLKLPPTNHLNFIVKCTLLVTFKYFLNFYIFLWHSLLTVCKELRIHLTVLYFTKVNTRNSWCTAETWFSCYLCLLWQLLWASCMKVCIFHICFCWNTSSVIRL